MKPTSRRLMLVSTVLFALAANGCVVAPARAHYRVWAPAHWSTPYGGVWIRGRWR